MKASQGHKWLWYPVIFFLSLLLVATIFGDSSWCIMAAEAPTITVTFKEAGRRKGEEREKAPRTSLSSKFLSKKISWKFYILIIHVLICHWTDLRQRPYLPAKEIGNRCCLLESVSSWIKVKFCYQKDGGSGHCVGNQRSLPHVFQNTCHMYFWLLRYWK